MQTRYWAIFENEEGYQENRKREDNQIAYKRSSNPRIEAMVLPLLGSQNLESEADTQLVGSWIPKDPLIWHIRCQNIVIFV